MFFRLNNGKPLSSIELTRVKAKSIEQIKELSKHELFTSTLTAKAISKYTNEDIVIKSWALLNEPNPSFETKYIRPLIESAEVTEQHVTDITTVYNRLLEVYQAIKVIDDKENNKIAKRVITRTHLLSLVPVIHNSLNNNITVEQITNFTKHFFNGKKSASISDIYNTASGSGSAKSENVKKRITAITEEYNKFFKKSEQKENTPTPVTAKKVDYSTINEDDWQEPYIPHEVTETLRYTY